jgi:hypothetical protein
MKRFAFFMLAMCLFLGTSAQDKKVAIASATASASQPGEEAKYAMMATTAPCGIVLTAVQISIL